MVFIELGDGPGDSVINLQLVTRLEYSDDDGALVVHFVGGTTVSLGATQGVWLCRQISDLARTGRLMAMWAPPVAHGGGNANVRTDPHNPASPQAPARQSAAPPGETTTADAGGAARKRKSGRRSAAVGAPVA